jgi:hypothetical protein
MNYYLQYKNTFDFGNRVQRQYLYQNPRNFYRISRYENVDGEVKSLVGNNSSIIFVIGIYENKVNCIKINEIRPQIFLRWFSTLIKNGITVEDIDNIEKTSDILPFYDRTGNNLFESKVKNKPIYIQTPNPYRTYTLDGIKYIQEIKLKNNILKQIL